MAGAMGDREDHREDSLDSEEKDQDYEKFDYAGNVVDAPDETLVKTHYRALFSRELAPVLLVSLVTAANGLLAIFRPLAERLVEHPRLFDMLIPYGMYHLSRSLSMAFGFVLVYLSFNLARRTRMSWLIAVLLLSLSLVLHVVRGGIEEHGPTSWLMAASVVPCVLNLVILAVFRKRFSVRSEAARVRSGLLRAAVVLFVALAYGTAGFFFLDRRDFRIDFQLDESVVRTLREFFLVGNDDLHAHSAHASWFLNSLRASGGLAFVLALHGLFRPIEYRLRTRPSERRKAAEILEAYGENALDYYKLLPDKSYLFSRDGKSMVAYTIANDVAIGLGDVVGPDESLAEFLKTYLAWCHENGWTAAFLQTSPDHLDLYRRCGLSLLKVGEDAVVDLDVFSSKTCNKKGLKSCRKKFQKEGHLLDRLEPPHSRQILSEIAEVSNEWLSLPGRRERGFSLGRFDQGELSNQAIYAVRDSAGKILAFVNQVRSYARGETSIDLMRHRAQVPNGTMDFLFIELFLSLHGLGFRRFNLGLAALSGVGEAPDAPIEEKAVHLVYEHMNRFFSYKGLRQYKSKFDPYWQERFLVYEGGAPGLARTALAILRAGEI